MTASDATGCWSFDGNGGVTNWDNGLPPMPGNDYYTVGFNLKTPIDTNLYSGSIPFAGDSLEVDSGSIFQIKCTNTIVVTNLYLAGGELQNANVYSGGAAPGYPNLAILDGDIDILANNSAFGTGGTNRFLNVQAGITDASGYSLYLTGWGTIILSGSNANNPYTGTITVTTNTTLRLGADGALPYQSRLTLQQGSPESSGGVLDMCGYSPTMYKLNLVNNTNSMGVVTNSKPDTLSTLSVGYGNSISFSITGGIIADNPSSNAIVAFTQLLNGKLTISSNVVFTYHGKTTISAGQLVLQKGVSIPNTEAIDIQNGATLDVGSQSASGGYTIGADQILTGVGSIIGLITVDGTVAPGEYPSGLPDFSNATIGAVSSSSGMTLAGTTLMKINRTNAPNADLISLPLKPLTLGGTLIVTNVGEPLQIGDQFMLFQATNFSQAFAATNLPALPATEAWDVSFSGGQGVLTVVTNSASEPPPTPIIKPVLLSGTNLNIMYSSSSGYNYYLESATNLASAVWVPIQTNSGGGTITNVVPIDPTKPQQYFRVGAGTP